MKSTRVHMEDVVENDRLMFLQARHGMILALSDMQVNSWVQRRDDDVIHQYIYLN